jgi:murein DD-endopeptidase MepM/ murein hydrolase activator NlpD
LHPPAVARTGGHDYIVYELHLTNYTGAAVNLTEVTVLAAADTTVVLRSFNDSGLLRNLRLIGEAADTSRPYALDGGRTAVLFIWAPVPPSGTPQAVRHRVGIRLPNRTESITSLTSAVSVNRDAPITISPPVRGTSWLAGIGPDPEAVPAHARLVYPSGGQVYMPQRFATDWVKVGPDGKLFHGDSTKNQNHYSFRQELLAVGDGVVRRIKTGVADNIPPDVTERMTTETVAGNYVLLQLDSGVFAFYGHMAAGSITVREGQRVRQGEVIGRIGNSGNSTGAHLHFHLMTAPSDGFVAAAEGVSFVLDRFEVIGQITPEQFEDTDRGIPIGPFAPRGMVRSRELPQGGMVVNF